MLVPSKKKSQSASANNSEKESANNAENNINISKGLQKEIEYSLIQWHNLEDTGVQRAVILYNDRINTWRQMVEIDKIIDDKPTINKIKEIAELRIRNLQAFRELETYNNTGKFLNRHPLVTHFSMRAQLEKMLKENTDAFLKEYHDVYENVKRYSSFVKSTNRSPEQKEKDKANLKKHTEREALMKDILAFSSPKQNQQ